MNTARSSFGVCRALVALAAGCLALASARADDPAPWLSPLHNGTLTIWVVRPSAHRPASHTATNAPKPVTVPVKPMQPMTYQEQTAGSFGQDASTYGQSPSEYALSASTTTAAIATRPAGTGYTEQTAGSFGQPSGDAGTAAGNHGQTAGSFGTPASDVGTTAGSYGRTAGSFGNSLSTIADAGNAPAPPGTPVPEPPGSALDALAQQVHDRFPDLTLRLYAVPADELAKLLRTTRGTAAYPDLLATPLTRVPSNQAAEIAAVTPIPAELVADSSTLSSSNAPMFVLLSDTPHAAEARAFLVWTSEGSSAGSVINAEIEPGDRHDAAAVAKVAIEDLAAGSGIGELADASMAAFPPAEGVSLRAVAHDSGPAVPVDGVTVRVEIEHAETNGPLAVVLLRVVTDTVHAFGVTHPMVVLRRDRERRWRVLHVSLNLDAAQAQDDSGKLLGASPPSATEAKWPVRPVSQAAPADGDTRTARPDLWWDNPGGVGLEVVEWQQRLTSAAAWAHPQLMLVEDTTGRLKTRVNASFARGGVYRWRVWSVSASGELAITPWRRLLILSGPTAARQ